jgi:hypothetical protein
MTTTAPPAARPSSAGSQASSAPAPPAVIWRRWRGPLAIIALVLIGGTVIALLKPAAAARGYLDPANTAPDGTHALADILAERGHQVIRVVTPAAAEAAAGQGGATVVVTNPEFLTRPQLGALALVPGNLVIVEPDAAALTALAPAISTAGATGIGPVRPGCALAAARLAGTADMGGIGLRVAPGTPGAVTCYSTGGVPSLAQYSSGGRVVTVLGTGAPLTNASLAQVGNAALALNLLSLRPRVVWLVPAPAIAAGAGSAGGQKSLTSLLPFGTYLVTLQLVIAVLLAALWRSRRLGPLVSEPLPVVVRASETVEGHARLYQSRRARGRAAAALRAALLRRVIPAVGLSRGSPPEAVTAALAARSGLGAARISTMLFGPAPASDAALVTLAEDLDDLEREVRAQ